MDLSLNGHVVLVTGASGGIGRAMVHRLHAEGATVVAHGFRGFAGLQAWCDPLGIPTVRCDLADPEATAELFEGLVGAHGRVDGVAANAGRWPEPELRLDETPPDSVRSTVADCLLTAMWTARGWMTALRRTGPRADGAGASLVFTGSTAGRFGEPNHSAYAASKAALRGLMRSLKNEVVHLDPHARVNVVEPGWTATPAVAAQLQPEHLDRVTRTMPLRRVATPEDIAQATAFLLSPVAARHVSGEILTVAGGMEGRTLWQGPGGVPGG